MKSAGAKPPRFAKRIFRWYCGKVMVEDLEGDMDELFYQNVKRYSARSATWKYYRQVFSLIGSYVIRRRRINASVHPHSFDLINFTMIRNYLLMAWRVMRRDRIYTFINVLGLTLGISACIIVFLVVHREFSFDKFHEGRERIYRIRTTDENHEGWVCTCAPAPVYTTLRDEYAGPQVLTGYHHFDAKISVQDKDGVKRFDRSTANIIFTQPQYFDIFQYQWMAGNKGALSSPFAVVLTEERAKTYFGNTPLQEVIGKQVIYNDTLQMTVGGVIKDWEENSDFKRTEFISFSTIEKTRLRDVIRLDNWGAMMHSSQSFVKIAEGDSPKRVAAQLTKVIRGRTTEKYLLELDPLNDIHFRPSDHDASVLPALFILSALAAFILIIASINFINLSTAQSISRSREIGIRKVMGSRKGQLVIQFVCETFILALVALVVSLALIRPLLFAFQAYLPKEVRFEFWSIDTWLFIVILLVAVSLLAGLYPAFVIAAHRPAVVLTGKAGIAITRGFSLRKTLVVFQFVFSLFFITATLIFSAQMDYIKNKDRGFSTDGVLTFRTNWTSTPESVGNLAKRIGAIYGDENVTMQGFSPMGFAMWTSAFSYTSDKGKMQFNSSIKAGDENYLPLYKLRLVAGRNYVVADTVTEALVNEAFVREMGISDVQDAIGEHVQFDNQLLTICGVVKDFHQQSFRQSIGPVLIGDFKSQMHSIAVRFERDGLENNVEQIASIETMFKEVFPDEPFAAHFIEEEIGWMHGPESRIANMASIAMGITIFISCMGAFGLAMFTSVSKTREIGIRKVMGASPWKIIRMLNKEFTILVLISIVIATPISWFFNNAWMTTYAYRIPLQWWYFAVAAVIALVTALITVSFHSMKAATSDPVKALRSE